MSTPSVEVDTSLYDSTLLGKSGMPGIDSAISPDVTDALLPIAGQDEFHQAMSQSSSAMSFVGSQQINATGTRADVLNFGKQFLGVPYVWGGTTPKGFDCSGFVQYVARRFGLNLPRLANQQAASGVRMAINQLQPGDLVAFGSDAHHIAFYLGNGQILESPHTGAQVRIRKLGSKENAWGVHLTYPGR